MSFILLGILNSQVAGGGGGYLTIYGSTGQEQTRVFITQDSAGNIYSGGRTDAGESSGNYRGNITKISGSAGTLDWSKKLTGENTQTWYSVSPDSNNNVSFGGNDTPSGSTRGNVVSFDSAGSVNWQKSLTNVDSIGVRSLRVNNNDVTVAAGNIFVSGSGDGIFLQSFDDTGSDVGKRVIIGPNVFDTWVAFDSSDNIHVATQQGHILKTNTTGSSITWQKNLSTGIELKDIDVDASGNVAVVGATGGECYVIVLTSSGAISWQKKFTSTSLFAVRFDSAGNVIVQGNVTGATSTDTILRKYNSSGTILWQRQMDNQDPDVTSYMIGTGGLAIDQNDDIYLVGRFNSGSSGLGNGDWYVMKYPGDGSYTGTFQLDGKNVEIVESAATDSTPTLTVGNTSHTAAAGTYTIGTSTQSVSAITLTEYTATFS